MAAPAQPQQKKTLLMTEGSIWKSILLFSVPLILGNLLQQLYNTADSIIVGNFLGGEALAAVGSSGSLIFLLTGFVNGVSLGAGVVVARYFGAKDWDRMRRTIHTTVALGLVAGVGLTVIGVILRRRSCAGWARRTTCSSTPSPTSACTSSAQLPLSCIT